MLGKAQVFLTYSDKDISQKASVWLSEFLKLNLRKPIGEFQTIFAYSIDKFDWLLEGVDETMLDLIVSCESPFSDLGKMAVTTVRSPTEQGLGFVTVAVTEGGYKVWWRSSTLHQLGTSVHNIETSSN